MFCLAWLGSKERERQQKEQLFICFSPVFVKTSQNRGNKKTPAPKPLFYLGVSAGVLQEILSGA